jgi:hypothetical protein
MWRFAINVYSLFRLAFAADLRRALNLQPFRPSTTTTKKAGNFPASFFGKTAGE